MLSTAKHQFIKVKSGSDRKEKIFLATEENKNSIEDVRPF